MKIVLATHNPHKLREISALLADSGVELLSLDFFPNIGALSETGSTLLENAFQKARAAHVLTGLPAIADDTGLEVDALHGAPGVFSARYAGEQASYADNNAKLLRTLREVPGNRRSARFRCVVAYVNGPSELWTEGVVEGMIAESPQGENGFGYDPVFYTPALNKTMAQLSEEEKNQLSHRGLALQKFRRLFREKIQPRIS